MTTFFEVISTSAPHIYHSALPLSPQTSIVRELHKTHVRPLGRVVRGSQILWEQVVATARHSTYTTNVAWSSCSRSIAVGLYGVIEILDAVTLERLHTFAHPRGETRWLAFSPDGRSLTRFHGDHGLTTWDLQTGGQISSTPSTSHTFSWYSSSAYSLDGKIVAVAHGSLDNTVTYISTYDLLSGTYIYSHQVSEGRIVASIWTHGEFLRFATVKPGSITVWEVGFASKHTLTEIETFPAPDNIGSGQCLFLPTRSRIAFIIHEVVLVWDARDSKILLNVVGGGWPQGLSFSSDGHFFACGTTGQEFYLWKEFPTGYFLHRKLVSDIYAPPHLSPNGESIITSKFSETWLWRTTDPITSISSVPTQPVIHTRFILGLSKDESLAAVAWLEDNTATVIDLRSGDTRLIIDTGAKILDLGVIGNTIAVVSGGGIITWNLPAEDRILDARVNINDSVRTIMFNRLTSPPTWSHAVSISPDFNYVAIGRTDPDYLEIFDMSTGKYLAGTALKAWRGLPLYFTPDEREVWYADNAFGPQGWKIVKDRKSDVVSLEPLGNAHSIPDRFPSHGHKVTDDGWILNSRETRLIWLPYLWRKYVRQYSQGGRFLWLLNGGLSEPVILELGE